MIAPIELRLGDHGIPFADEADRPRLNSLRIRVRPSMTASLKSSRVLDYFPHPGGVPAACIRRYETGRTKQSSSHPTAAGELNS